MMVISWRRLSKQRDALEIWLKKRMRVELCVVPAELGIHAGQRMVSQVRSMHIRMFLVIVRVLVPVKWNPKWSEYIMESLRIMRS